MATIESVWWVSWKHLSNEVDWLEVFSRQNMHLNIICNLCLFLAFTNIWLHFKIVMINQPGHWSSKGPSSPPMSSTIQQFYEILVNGIEYQLSTYWILRRIYCIIFENSIEFALFGVASSYHFGKHIALLILWYFSLRLPFTLVILGSFFIKWRYYVFFK